MNASQKVLVIGLLGLVIQCIAFVINPDLIYDFIAALILLVLNIVLSIVVFTHSLRAVKSNNFRLGVLLLILLVLYCAAMCGAFFLTFVSSGIFGHSVGEPYPG